VLLLHALYDTEVEVISEDVIMKWFEETVKSGDESVMKKIVPYICAFHHH